MKTELLGSLATRPSLSSCALQTELLGSRAIMPSLNLAKTTPLKLCHMVI